MAIWDADSGSQPYRRHHSPSWLGLAAGLVRGLAATLLCASNEPGDNSLPSIACMICRSVTMSPAKTAEPSEMPFVMRTQLGPMNDVFRGSRDPRRKEQFFGGGPL